MLKHLWEYRQQMNIQGEEREKGGRNGECKCLGALFGGE